ncbi:MAG: LodA/GoxA family CTQ-dependent oxidase [Gloeotrichia echinulata HAB0833]
MADTYKVFPAIGIARVGNSNEYYLAPEEPGGLPILLDGQTFQPSDFRDSGKNLRRQAARFRIYRYPESGGEPQEIVVGNTIGTRQVTQIIWTVRLANKKAIWYEFQTKNGEQGYASNHPLRNSSVTGEKRKELMIDPGGRTLTSLKQSASFSRDTQTTYPMTFPPKELYPQGNEINSLGMIRTDDQGRLIVVGGFGHSGSINPNPSITDYANNDGWWDDTSDGPVTATVLLDNGQNIEVVPAWVLVAPPAYAPQIVNLITLYDTIFDVAVRQMEYHQDIYKNGFWNQEYRPDFEQEIKPILERASLFPWVTAMPPKPHTFDYELLGNPDQRYNGMRQYFFSQVRPPDKYNTLKSSTTGYPMMPYLAGDDAVGSSQKAAKFLTLTQTQYFFLQQWAKGKFTNNGTNTQPVNKKDPGEKLTRAALENCVGGAFSPGIEMTWISRNPEIYSEPFRIKHKKMKPMDRLSLDMNLKEGLEPGDITKFMALPWQADFNECSSQPVDGRFVWWWPAQRPEFVYLPPNLQVAFKAAPSEELKNQQAPWLGTDYDQNAEDYIAFANDLEMVEKWHQLGFVFDISKVEEYQYALQAINWEGSYFAEVERTLARTTLPSDTKIFNSPQQYRSRSSTDLT